MIDRLPGAKGPHPNRVGAEIEPDAGVHARYRPFYEAYKALYPALRQSLGGMPNDG